MPTGNHCNQIKEKQQNILYCKRTTSVQMVKQVPLDIQRRHFITTLTAV